MNDKPHPVWWIGHFCLGVLTGLAVYLLYKDKNPEAARRHLVYSVIIHTVLAAVTFSLLVAMWVILGEFP